MKKTLFWIAVLILTFLPLAAQTITLISPAGGESWTSGGQATILWNSSGVAGARLILYRFGTAAENRIGIVAAGLAAASGSYSWTVGSYQGGTVPAGGGYYIRVRSDNGDVSDVNDAPFTIAAAPQVQPSFTLLLPNGGESWVKGSDTFISWTAANMPGNCRLVLLKNGQEQGIIRDSLPPGGPGGSSVPWKVGETLGGPAGAGSGYKIRIQSLDGLYSDSSDNPFTITQLQVFRPQISIVRPFQLPDLVVCMRWDGGTPLIYQDKRVKVWVKNSGQASAPASTLKVYVEGHGDRIIPVPALAANAQFYWTAKFDWPTCGHKTVRATADIQGVATERNEENNVLEGRIEVSCGLAAYMLEMTLCSDGTQAPQ